MKNIIPALLLSSLLASIYSISVTATEQHHHHEQSSDQLSLNQGEKWSIDDSLHTGMNNIKQAMNTNLDDIHYNRFSKQQYVDLAKTLEQQLSYLFENCKLAPEADAQLHILLAKIMQGVDKMKNSAKPKQGAILIIQSLNNYPVYFNDPNWQNINH